MTYDIFISYKRKGASSATAAYLYELLTQKGYNVFFDRKEMRSGKFNEQILEHISGATDIIILLEDESLSSWFKAKDEIADNTNAQSLSTIDAYKTDWFCKEIIHALSIKGKNIIPVLLNGYTMPKANDLPLEMSELALHNALPLDISEAEDFFRNYLVDKAYLKSKPKNLTMARRYALSGNIVGCLLFYTNVDSCTLYECGERVATLTQQNDEDHPFRFPISFGGEHRFSAINNDSCEVVKISKRIETGCQEYIYIQFSQTQNLWELTPSIIATIKDQDVLYNWGRGLFEGNEKHSPDFDLALECFNWAYLLGSPSALQFLNKSFVFSEELRVPYDTQIKWHSLSAKVCHEQKNTVDEIESLRNLGYSYYANAVNNNGSAILAFQTIEKAKDLMVTFYGEVNPQVMFVYRDMGIMCDNLDKGLEMCLKAKDIGIKLYGKDDPEVGRTYHYVGCIYREMEKWEEALYYFREACRVWLPAYGINHEIMNSSYGNQGKALMNLGHLEEALECYDTCLKIQDNIFDEKGYDYAVCEMNRAVILAKMGRKEDALLTCDAIESVLREDKVASEKRSQVLMDRCLDFRATLMNQ